MPCAVRGPAGLHWCVCSDPSGEEDAGDPESKLPTAEDFTDIAELAEEERMQISQEQETLVKESQEKEKERLYQKGVTFLQAASTGEEELEEVVF